MQGLFIRADLELPSLFSFVLTGASGGELYVAALRVYEPLTVMEGNWTCADRDSNPPASPSYCTVFVPKCICVISQWPFYSCFASFLKQLYQISLSPSDAPIEYHLASFMFAVPVPRPGQPASLYRLGTICFLSLDLCITYFNSVQFLCEGNSDIKLSRPSHFYTPMRDFSFRSLFECLSVSHDHSFFR